MAVSSLYIHIPFCERKCLYCDFYSIESLSARRPFLDALLREIEITAENEWRGELRTLFFGGGTPSLLNPDELAEILEHLRLHWMLSPDAEVTVETNPGTVDKAKLSAFRSLGVNRLSIGIQSFDEAELRFLSRIHDQKQAVRAVEDARAAGFDNVNIDLIFSLPGQTSEQWRATVRRAIELEPEHLSAYSLIVEDDTPLARLVHAGNVVPNGIDVEADLYRQTMEWMGESGYEHYEVSNYARGGRRCLHNLAYWHHDSYLGFGPSAHSFEHRGDGTGRRWGNVANISTYVRALKEDRVPRSFEETLDRRALARESVFLGLRADGLPLHPLLEQYGFDVAAARSNELEGLLKESLAVLDGEVLRLTDRGYLLCDEIACRLMP
jgi:oxygen-independent coproporphyrinogen-3 oxidase